MSAANPHSEISEVAPSEIELAAPNKEEPLTQDASISGAQDRGRSRERRSRTRSKDPASHATSAAEHAPSNRPDAAQVGHTETYRDQAPAGIVNASGGTRGADGKKGSSSRPVLDKSGTGDPGRQPVQDKLTRDKKQDKSVKEDKSVRDRSERDKSTGGGRLDASTRSTGGGARERVGSFVQRVISVRHPKDPRKTGPQERPRPNANEVKLLDAANVSHDFFVSFAEVQWIANLSEGDMGEVHRVRWRGVDCAAKTAKGNMVTGPNAQRSQVYKDMLKEIYIMSKLGHHPNIVGFFGVSMGPGGSPMILIELINGPTLDHFLASMEGMLPHWRKQRPTVAAWAKGLLKGMDFLHSREPIILHRDVKPGNLLLSEGLRTLKIADFGVSRILKTQDRLKRQLTGMTGTRRYMAPEVYGCKQGVYTEKADIYSCSLVIWEMAMGLKPFNDVAPSELAQRKVREVLRPSLEPLEWKELAALIAKGWDREAESRPSARAMYEELCTLNGMPDPNVEVSPMSTGQPDGLGGVGGLRAGDATGDTSVACNCNCSIS